MHVKGYLDQTHAKVATFRTLLRPQPIDLVSNFVPMTISSGKEQFDEVDLAKRLIEGSRYIVTAPAGRGKSMLMRYLAMTRYENPMGYIPLFIELRHLNDLSKRDILTYAWYSYGGEKYLTNKSFLSSLSNGSFLLIFDGFDEINPEFRQEIVANIIDISRLYPKCSIIVSGRPDESFKSWPTFQSLNVEPLSKQQVLTLIDKLDYESLPKRRFTKAVKDGLYESHSSFLSTPLLAILMLMTFEQFAEIPDKIHIFYDNAFETLFRRHDATKALFFRKTRSGLAIDTFRKVFSAFCAISYMKNDFSFSRESITEYIEKALKYNDVKASAPDVLDDLTEALCVLQLEGFEYSFVHRSFQEYFCAVFVSKAATADRIKLLPCLTTRFYDNVIPMLFDMAPDLFEVDWVLPNVARIIELRDSSSFSPYVEIDNEIGSLTFSLSHKKMKFCVFMPKALSTELFILHRIYPAHFVGVGAGGLGLVSKAVEEKFAEVVKDRIAAGDNRFYPKKIETSANSGRSVLAPFTILELVVDDIPMLVDGT